MKIFTTVEEMQDEALANRRRGAEVGFVPTMGALHEGHLSLFSRARDENEVVVASIFVNPTQFDEDRDFDTYPRTLEEDLAACEAAGADAVFAPPADEMYSPRYQTTIFVQKLSDRLCGLTRGRGHFVGVCSVVAKLFNIVLPTTAYFGQKDAQQAVIIQRMVEDLNFPVEIVVCPTVREADGLALSSRNRRIPPDRREEALSLYRALQEGRNMIRGGETDAQALQARMAERILETPGVELEYLNVVGLDGLEDVERVEDTVLIAGAIRVGGVRLIDNILVGPEGPWEA